MKISEMMKMKKEKIQNKKKKKENPKNQNQKEKMLNNLEKLKKNQNAKTNDLSGFILYLIFSLIEIFINVFKEYLKTKKFQSIIFFALFKEKTLTNLFFSSCL